MALKKAVGVVKQLGNRLLGAGVLSDGLGSLRDGVLGQLSGQDQTDGGLDFPAGDGGTLVVVGKTGSFTGNTLEDVVDERVHDAHSLAGDTSVGVDLLEHLVDVDGITLTSLLPAASLACWLGGLSCLLGAFGANLGWHVVASLSSSELNEVHCVGSSIYMSSCKLSDPVQQSFTSRVEVARPVLPSADWQRRTKSVAVIRQLLISRIYLEPPEVGQ